MSWSELNKDYVRVSPDFLCPICGKADGCLVHKSGEHVICYHVQSTTLWKIGFLHRLSTVKAHSVKEGLSGKPQHSSVRKPHFDKLNAMYSACITSTQIDTLAVQLGVSAASLIELSVGWSNTYKVYTFPVRNAQCQVTGIQTRDVDGNKRMIKGSEAGVFLPSMNSWTSKHVFVTEGLSDTAVARTMGLTVVGRFNDVSGSEILMRMLGDTRGIYVISDNSGAEIRGAATLRDQLRSVAQRVSMIVLPFNFKDLRAMLNTVGAYHSLQILFNAIKE